jgi:hypothetical protein
MPRKYPFYPAWDGKKASPVTEWFAYACKRRWGFSNLGLYQNRMMRSSNNLSVHATGWAVDIGYGSSKEGRAKALQAFDWFMKYSEELRICEVHDYAYGKYGRGYRGSRGAGMAGVVVYKDLASSAGTPGGTWLHVEISNDWESAEAFEKAWRALPKP